MSKDACGSGLGSSNGLLQGGSGAKWSSRCAKVARQEVPPPLESLRCRRFLYVISFSAINYWFYAGPRELEGVSGAETWG